MDKVFEYDVLVVGAGNAALAAAVAAIDQKAKVAVLEKAPKEERGGNSTLTGHFRFVYDGIQDLRPIVKNMAEADLQKLVDRMPHRTQAEIWDDFMSTTNNQSDEEMLQVHVAESLNTVKWLVSKGHDWVPASEVSDNILMPNGGGYGVVQRNATYLEKAGAAFHYETSASELIEDDQGRVVGVRARTKNGFATFRAKSVVLACGGFEANAEMRARYLGPGWDTVRVRGVPFNTGDGLRMALDIGAMPHGSWTTCHASPQDINMPRHTLPSTHAVSYVSPARYLYPLSIMVNIHGKRFVDESSDTRGKTYAMMGRAILTQPGGIAYQIMDAKIRKQNLYLPQYSIGTTVKANSIEALAQELDIDANSLVNTIKEFNAGVQPGKFNPDKLRVDGKGTRGVTPPKSNYALTLDEGPYEAWPVRCGITFTFGGLKIDPHNGQVQHVSGRPMSGLYCAGEMAGGLFHGNYPSGSGMMAGATFGRIAGTNAAKAALQAG